MHGELLVVGVVVGLLVAALIASKPGKASGGHMNPAIRLAMWRIGRFQGELSCPTRPPSSRVRCWACWPRAAYGGEHWPPGPWTTAR